MLSETQLETWSKPGAVTKSINAHESIREAVMAEGSPVRGKNIDFYLQGSYKNSTNVRVDSDVDVAVQLNDVFYRDLSLLPSDQERLYKSAYSESTYTYWNFRTDVLKALIDYYGPTKAIAGNKSIRISGDANRQSADVVPCLQFRRYKRFLSLTDQDFVEGMTFFTAREQREIINYPKVHYENGCIKSSPEKTSGLFKATVRIFKNARTWLVDNNRISTNLAPSYFIECLTYNVPDSKFGSSLQSTYYNVLNWLKSADMTNFVSQNEQIYLFGNTPEQWSIESAKKLVEELLKI